MNDRGEASSPPRPGALGRLRSPRGATPNREHLQSLSDVALAHLDLDGLLAGLVHRLREIVAADSAAILLLDDDGQRLVVRASDGADGQVVNGTTAPVAEGYPGSVVQDRRTLALDDVAGGAVLLPHAGLREFLGSPLVAGDKVLGVAHVGRRARRFSIVDVRLLELAADRIALAIERAHLYSAERSARSAAETANRRLAFLAKASEVMSDSLDFGQTLENLVRLAVPGFADGCMVDLVDGELVTRAAGVHVDRRAVPRLLPPRPARPLTATLRQALVARHAGVVGQALPETLLSSAQGRESEAPGVGRRTMDEVALVPLVARDRVLGGLWLVRSATPVRFSSDDLAFAEELAHRAALAIDNARLYLEAEQAKRAQEESFALLDTLFATAPVGLTFLDTEQRYVRINQALAATNGPPIETHLGRRPSEVLGRLGEEVEACLTKVLLTGEPVVDLEVSGETPTEPGVRRHWLASYYPVRSPHGEALGVGGVVADITDRKRAQELLAGESAILEHIARGAPLGETLTALARLIEHHAPGGLCSILVLDEHRLRLTMGAAPSLPPEYNAAIEGLRIGPDVGSCGTAAYTGRPVVVTDIAHDPLWESHRDLAREHGLAACWSAPITGYKGGEVLGTFAIYYRRARGPGDKEWELVELATYLAAIAIERERWEINRWRESRAAGEGMPPP